MSMPSPANTATNVSLPAPPLPAAGADWALLLDVDGTLLDFVDDPDAIRVDAALLTLLDAAEASPPRPAKASVSDGEVAARR